MKLTYDTIAKAARKVPDRANANALIVALNQYGDRYGLLVPHRSRNSWRRSCTRAASSGMTVKCGGRV